MFLNILMLLFAVSLAMAKRRRRRNWSKYIDGAIDFVLAATTLAPNTLVSGTLGQSVVDTTRVSSIRCAYSLSNVTPATSVGPMIFGVAHSDYADSEIEQWVESTASWDIGDKIAAEIRGRLVRQIGTFPAPASAAEVVTFNDGRPMKTKLNWLLAEGDTLKFWVYNTGATAYGTTVPNFKANGKANLWQV